MNVLHGPRVARSYIFDHEEREFLFQANSYHLVGGGGGSKSLPVDYVERKAKTKGRPVIGSSSAYSNFLVGL